MEVIAATKFNEVKRLPRRNRSLQLILVLVMIVVIFLSFLYQAFYWLLVLIPIVYYLWRYQGRNLLGDPFLIAFLQQDMLHIDFEETSNTSSGRVRYGYPLITLEIPIPQVISYHLHSFLKNEPEMMEISFKRNEEIVKTRPIPLFYLDPPQQDKLITFMDELTKRKNSSL